jgi:hypothetical protein
VPFNHPLLTTLEEIRDRTPTMKERLRIAIVAHILVAYSIQRGFKILTDDDRDSIDELVLLATEIVKETMNP